MKEFCFPSVGHGEIHCYVLFPKTPPIGIVQIIHGIAEYFPRYADLAAYLNAKGLIVCGEDHMGHGNSISSGVKGYFHGGWLSAVEDSHTLFSKMSAEHPQLPYFLLGHSMGSFMARTFLYTYPKAALTGVLLSGTAWQPSLVLKAGKAMCRLEEKRLGTTGVSSRLTKLMFGAYCKGFDDVRTPHDWICSVREVVDAYEKDPLCGFDATIGLSYDMLCGIEMNQKKKNLAAMPASLPVLFYAGDKDPVGANGKGVKKAYDAFRSAGMQQVGIKLYPNGRHEMHNEINRAEVYADVWHWISKRL